MADESLLSFEELDVKMGQLVEIRLPNSPSKEFFDVVLIGAIMGESLILGAPESGLFPNIHEGDPVVIRIRLADGVALFSTVALFISDIPLLMAFIDFPTEIKFKQVRKASRVNVTLPVLTSNTTTGEQVGIAGKLVDISTAGAGILIYEFLGDVGDEITVKGKFDVGGIQKILAINATIRSCKQIKEAFLCGIEFNNCEESDLLVLFGFIFNAMAFGRIQKIR